MKCIFCGGEVRVGQKCPYCDSYAEPSYYPNYTEPSVPLKIYKADEVKPGKYTYTVQPGDCLWNIAKAFYGSGSKAYEIAKKNNIRNPNLIYPGQVLKL